MQLTIKKKRKENPTVCLSNQQLASQQSRSSTVLEKSYDTQYLKRRHFFSKFIFPTSTFFHSLHLCLPPPLTMPSPPQFFRILLHSNIEDPKLVTIKSSFTFSLLFFLSFFISFSFQKTHPWKIYLFFFFYFFFMSCFFLRLLSFKQPDF